MALKTLSFIFMAFVTLFLIWGFGWLWFATTIAMAKPNEDIAQTDAIVVLTGGNGRVNAGLNLLAEKISDDLFISGVNEEVKEKDILASWKTPSKTKPCCIHLGYKAEDTTGNATEVYEWVEENGVESFQLVTSSYHMPRAYLELSRILPETAIFQYPVLTDDFEAWKGRFWTLTFSEYNKTIVSWLRLNQGE